MKCVKRGEYGGIRKIFEGGTAFTVFVTNICFAEFYTKIKPSLLLMGKRRTGKAVTGTKRKNHLNCEELLLELLYYVHKVSGESVPMA